MPAPKIRYSAFLLPKSDSDIAECQDAICAIKGCKAPVKGEYKFAENAKILRFAVADGVATAFYSGYWAKQLVALFRKGRLKDWKKDGPKWKEAADKKWQCHLMSKRVKLGAISKNRLNERDPAAATFCGIEITKNDQNALSWRMIAVGDSCVIHLPNSAGAEGRFPVCESYPCERAIDFSCITAAISNYEPYSLPPQFIECIPKHSILSDGDVVLLASDALCEWMFKLNENKTPVWETIVKLDAKDPQEFQELITAARYESDPERRLKDDDVALIVICVGDKEPAFIDKGFVYKPGVSLPKNSSFAIKSAFSAFLSNTIHGLKSQERPILERLVTSEIATVKAAHLEDIARNLPADMSEPQVVDDAVTLPAVGLATAMANDSLETSPPIDVGPSSHLPENGIPDSQSKEGDSKI